MKRITALILLLCICTLMLAACQTSEPCAYVGSRSIEGRDIHYVEMKVTGYGTVVILLDATSAPVTVANFLKLVRSGFYDGLTFHRIIKDFMIQGGDPKGDGTGGSEETIYGEFETNGYYFNDLNHIRGVISMARGDDNDSASSQFFICNANAMDSLDGGYAAFGYVVEGMEVVDKITDKVFPKTKYADLYGNTELYPEYPYYLYGWTYHYIWAQYGNGAVEKAEDKPVIEYIRVLDNYEY